MIEYLSTMYIPWVPYTTVMNVALQKNKQEEAKPFLRVHLFHNLSISIKFFSWNLLNFNSRSPDSVFQVVSNAILLFSPI